MSAPEMKRCGRHGVGDHDGRSCPLRQPANRCALCHKQGHRSKNCEKRGVERARAHAEEVAAFFDRPSPSPSPPPALAPPILTVDEMIAACSPWTLFSVEVTKGEAYQRAISPPARA